MLGPELVSFTVIYSGGARQAPVGKYVEAHSTEETEHFAQSVCFMRKLSIIQGFAMRSLIRAFPERTMVLLEWS